FKARPGCGSHIHAWRFLNLFLVLWGGGGGVWLGGGVPRRGGGLKGGRLSPRPALRCRSPLLSRSRRPREPPACQNETHRSLAARFEHSFLSAISVKVSRDGRR